MPFIKKLDRYDAFLYPSQDKQSGRINLYCQDHKLYLLFLDPSTPSSPNSFNPATKIGVAHQPFSQYQHFLDLVRNEKPISVTFRPEDAPPTFVVFCAGETPGEGEM
ncbi:MAG: hypothetical protein JNN15_00915 [Blastocatellia bacterium]|nr:hypothetical protein [Blastocatellia bacterium]